MRYLLIPAALALAACGKDAPSETAASVNRPPAFATSSATVQVIEEAADTGYIPAASDPDGDSLRYSIEGADAGLLTFDSSNRLRFKQPPLFEVPASAGGTNTYSVTIIATDGKNTASQSVLINVINGGRLSPSVTEIEANTNRGSTLMASFSSSDGAIVRIQGRRGDDGLAVELTGAAVRLSKIGGFPANEDVQVIVKDGILEKAISRDGETKFVYDPAGVLAGITVTSSDGTKQHTTSIISGNQSIPRSAMSSMDMASASTVPATAPLNITVKRCGQAVSDARVLAVIQTSPLPESYTASSAGNGTYIANIPVEEAPREGVSRQCIATLSKTQPWCARLSQGRGTQASLSSIISACRTLGVPLLVGTCTAGTTAVAATCTFVGDAPEDLERNCKAAGAFIELAGRAVLPGVAYSATAHFSDGGSSSSEQRLGSRTGPFSPLTIDAPANANNIEVRFVALQGQPVGYYAEARLNCGSNGGPIAIQAFPSNGNMRANVCESLSNGAYCRILIPYGYLGDIDRFFVSSGRLSKETIRSGYTLPRPPGCIREELACRR